MVEAAELGRAGEILIHTSRPGGSWERQPLWCVHVDGDAYVRSAFGTRSFWYRRVLGGSPVRIEVAGRPHPARLHPVHDHHLNELISDAFRAKYGLGWPGPVQTVVSAEARATTLRILLGPDPRPAPAGGRGLHRPWVVRRPASRARSTQCATPRPGSPVRRYREAEPPVIHEQQSAPAPSGEVGLLIARQVDPGHEEEFEAWANGILSAAAQFPGHLGYGLFRPTSPGTPWYLIHRFRNTAAHQEWHRSPERAAWLGRSNGHHTEVSRRQLTGLETWFAIPDHPTQAPPPRWKMTTTAILGIFPVSLLVATVLQPALSSFPFLARTAVVAVFFSVVMTYAAMPLLTRALRRWLY
ncbi:DUF2255 family protein [Streptomyces sp. NPDC059460]|uniref:DUF2255 family protein n=1 Tax=Streptomyces sp. NPDC059460 TaxID=3346840 RepID=UPI0036C1C888